MKTCEMTDNKVGQTFVSVPKGVVSLVLGVVVAASHGWAQDALMKAGKMPGAVKQLRQLQESVDAGDTYPTPDGPRKLYRLPGRYVVRGLDAKGVDDTLRPLSEKGKPFDGYGRVAVRTHVAMLSAPGIGTEKDGAPNAVAPVQRRRDKPGAEAVKASLLSLRQDTGIRVDPVFVDPDSGLLRTVGTDIILRLKAGVNAQAYFGGAWERARPLDGTKDQFILTLEAQSAEEVLEDCFRRAADTRVEWAEPDFEDEVVRQHTPNDTYFAQQWHLKGAGAGSVQAETAWDTAKGDDVVIAIVDDGVQTTHPDLAANIFSTSGHDTGYAGDVNGWNFAEGTPNVNPAYPDDSHGTAVAGVAAAVGDNGIGVSGVAFRSKILPVKVFAGDYFVTASQMASALRYAAGLSGSGWRGADVINLSLGFSQTVTVDSALTDAATNGREGKGCPIFVSSGNGAVDWMDYPISVTAGTHTLRIEYTKDSSVSEGMDCAWLDDVWMPGSAAEGFEGTTFPPPGWTTGGNAPWVQETNVAFAYPDGNNGVKSARSGAITHSQSTWIQTTRTFTAGTIWVSLMSSSEFSYDVINVYVDNVKVKPYGAQYDFTDPGGDYVVTTIGYPASHASTIAIGASTDGDIKSYYSQYGTGLDFVAPSNGGGNGIYTTDRTGADGYTAGDYNSNFSGTSSASPLAAGIGALILSKNPALTASEVRTILRKSCAKVGNVTYSGGDSGAGGWNTYYGYGRITASTALANTPDPSSQLSLSVTPASMSVGSGAGSSNVTVTANVAWNVSTNATWLFVSPTSGSGNGAFTVSYTANSTGSPRSGMVTVSGTGVASENITVTQDATSSLTLGEAVNQPTWDWQTGGSTSWLAQTGITHDGLHATQSGAITHNQSSWIETKVKGTGTLSFWWKVSSEQNYDWLTCTTNGVMAFRISGERDWALTNLNIASVATVTVRWEFSKDDSDFYAVGSNCAWLDDVSWIPSSGPTETQTTPVPVPYWWLDEKYPTNDRAYMTYETLANAIGANGYAVWESYVAGLDPTNAASKFRITSFAVGNVNGKDTVTVLEWTPNYANDPPPLKRDYIIEGKTNLTDTAWHSPTNSGTRFFRVKVYLP
ncbi:MAG: S8 family serine peptidase [Kiritimatiellaeota bacterium]|nr:S8 family serine peptidase [Kiritimatiellota bacterium]